MQIPHETIEKQVTFADQSEETSGGREEVLRVDPHSEMKN